MTPEQRIAQLEEALALEQAKVRELSAVVATQATALADAMAERRRSSEALALLDARREAARLKKQRQRALRGSNVGGGRAGVSRDPGAVMSPGLSRDNVGTTPAPPPPFPSSFPPSPETSSPYPLSFPPSSPPPSASQEPESVPERPELVLEAQRAGRKPRKPSGAERLFSELQRMREERCAEVGEEPFIREEWPVAMQNTRLKSIVEAASAAQARFESAWLLYLADDGQRERLPAWSLSYFMSAGVRAMYETRAAREEAA